MSAAVFFFGGFNATQVHIDEWLKSARTQKPNIDFTGFPWPNFGNLSSSDAITTIENSKAHKSMVAAIEAASACPIYLVGHSSGCAIANHVDRSFKRNKKIDLTRIGVVSLDGDAPNEEQRRRKYTSVWGAMYTDVDPKNSKQSFNFPGGVPGHEVYAALVSTKWALHFSLVNTATTDDPLTTIATGYAKCVANLMWLKNETCK